MSTRRWRSSARSAAVGIAAAAITVTACSSSKHVAAGQPAAAATRWWSNSVVSVGSTIAPADPTSAAAKLSASRDQYCQMLKQTLAVGKSLLPSAAAKDPRLLPTTEAFVAEVQAVAPASVQPSWKVLAPVILQLVRSGGALPTGPASSAASMANNVKAAEAINADAKANCHLDLSTVVTGG
jgi:hypothetical protein